MKARRMAWILTILMAAIPLAVAAQTTTTTMDAKTAQREAERRQREAELARLETEQNQRQSQIEAREAKLIRQREQRAGFHLRELINAVDRDDRQPLDEISKLRAADDDRRAARARAVEKLKSLRQAGQPESEEQAELAGQIDNDAESITLDNLRVARWEARIMLAQEADRIDKFIAALPVNPRPTVRLMAEKVRNRKDEGRRLAELQASMADERQSRSELDPAAQILENKHFESDAAIKLLQGKYDLARDRSIRDQIDAEKARYRLLGDRIGIVRDQQTAIDDTLAEQDKLRDLYATELTVLREDADTLLRRYWHSVMIPAAAILGVVLLYLLVSLALLPRMYRRDRLFTARRLSRYAMLLVVILVILGFFFEDLRPFATTLGIAGAAVVIALQDLCSSFAGWFVIVASRKVRVGDRIEVDGHRGDVLDVQLLRTTMLELRNWLDVDEPTGRVIVIPNSFIFKEKVVNFTLGHPYVWEKIDITVTFETPFQDAEALLRRVLEEETRAEFAEARQGAGQMEKMYGVPDAEYVPKLYSVIADSGVLFQLIFVTHYRRVSSTRTRINTRILREFEADKRMQLAYPTQREIKEWGGAPKAAAEPKAASG